MVDKEKFYSIMREKGNSDYETYLKINELLECQKDFNKLCNQDELQFQIVHQIEEMYLKLAAYTLVDICQYMEERHTFRALTLFRRVHIIQQHVIDQADLLETMSPADYQAIRTFLGSGSGVTSPGFKALKSIFPQVWQSYTTAYLEKQQLTIEQVYHTAYSHNDAYMIAEALAEMDALHHRFFKRHLDLIARSIGGHSKSLRGRAVETLKAHTEQHLFPELWSIRDKMTDAWGLEYGSVRPSLANG